MKLLHIDSSITGENSASRAVSGAIVAALRAADPSLEVVHRDLVAEPLPHLTLDVLGNPEGTPELAEFLAADVLVIGAAMYNFTIPSQLKAWFDRVLIAGKTFRYTAEGPVGLAGGKKVFIALARGGYYGDGQPAAAVEHAETYLRAVLGFVGIQDPVFVVAEGLAIDADTRTKAVAAAVEQAGALAIPA
ncbi:FMN-dependent NADH-azoreductase [Novosphingobium panipatense]|jgi:FMN-dependent NADH-azoreductase|uniref:FMN dependent NADH:quinone oxidoreductase n=1 Tax=Novosphingobium panipatense TaxID=428991 RepID=A0ABY1QEY3_9SPHN|nr:MULTISPECIES: FMN-dependent NADH-azoreductase [Novosphingobium]SMP66275.1 FMN-dependent NADH-azoreductase [Novosphingobium panipatense]